MMLSIRRVVAAFVGIFVAFAAGALILWLQGFEAGASFAALFNYGLLSKTSLFGTLFRMTPLLLTGLSAALAFGSNAINLGQLGQLVCGALAVTLVGLSVDLPAPIMIPLLLASAIIGGALFAGIAAFWRLRFGMNEFITTLMLNFLADFFALYLISGPLRDPDLFSAMTRRIHDGGTLPYWNQFPSAFLVAVAAFVLIYLLHRHTRIGYEMRLMGQNERFTAIGGCNNRANFMLVMLMSGALAGLAGGLLVMGGQQHRFIRGIGASYAWDGVMLAIIGAGSIVATALYAFFFAILQTGAIGMEIETSVPFEFVLVFQAIIVLLVVASRESTYLFVNRVAMALRMRQVRRSHQAEDAAMAKGG